MDRKLHTSKCVCCIQDSQFLIMFRREKSETVVFEVDWELCNITAFIIMSKTLMQSQLLQDAKRNLYLLVLESPVAHNHASYAVS